MTTAVRDAYQKLITHRHYRYRGCAPDPDQPTRAAGDLSLPVGDGWATTLDGESQTDRAARRRAALAVCHACPVIDACRAYANTETDEGELAEPHGIWGGQVALDRHRARVARRHDTAAAELQIPEDDLRRARSAQRQAVLAALAAETDPERVAEAAGVDVRTANWQRSALCSLLRLDKTTATRAELLDRAARLGLLPDGVVPVPDGPDGVPAAPCNDGPVARRPAPAPEPAPEPAVEEGPVQLAIPGVPDYPRTRPPAARARLRLAAQRPTAPLTLPYRALEAAA